MLRGFLGLALVVTLGSPARAQPEPSLLTHGITGSEDPAVPDRLSPSYVLSQIKIQRLLLEIAAEPRAKTFIEAVLEGTDVGLEDLEKIGLLREVGGRYVVAFALFTRADVAKVRQVTEARANALATAYLVRRAEIDRALARYPANGVDRRALAFILLGCFSLDWDGLELAAEKGYRVPAVVRPGLGKYTIWAEERGELTLKGIYWGSHNQFSSDFALTSFGDHFSLPRPAFPDLLWRLSRTIRRMDLPVALRVHLAEVTSDAWSQPTKQVAQVMRALRSGPKNLAELAGLAGLEGEAAKRLLALLGELEYVRETDGRYAAAIPVLTEEDAPMVRELLQLSRQTMDAWLATNYEPIRNELRDITPLRYGVPYDQTFTQIWHYLFGITNRRLVDAGMFADPYAPGRKYKGFIPVVWHPSLIGQP